MKRVLTFVLIFSVASAAFTQMFPFEVGIADPTRLGIDTGQQFLREVSLDRFEREGFWRSSISADDGLTTTRLFLGSPAGKTPIPGEEGLNIQDIHVLGTRVDFFRRGHTSFMVYPIRPIAIEGITKTVSVWVAGRNFNHTLMLVIEDFFGRRFELTMGRLNFQGWRRLTVAIPPQAEDGFQGIVQRNFHHNHYMGIRILGFRVVVDPMQAIGSYYIYFDDLRAVVDLFMESHRDPDDMPDGW